MRVIVTKLFKASFTSSADLTSFIAEFKSWKNAGDPCSSLHFGKNVSTMVPQGNDFDTLWHVHLAPSNEEDFQRWERLFQSKTHHTRCNRTSDLLLFYASWKNDFILLAVDNHSLMRPPLDALNGLCETANHGVKWLMSNG